MTIGDRVWLRTSPVGRVGTVQWVSSTGYVTVSWPGGHVGYYGPIEARDLQIVPKVASA